MKILNFKIRKNGTFRFFFDDRDVPLYKQNNLADDIITYHTTILPGTKIVKEFDEGLYRNNPNVVFEFDVDYWRNEINIFTGLNGEDFILAESKSYFWGATASRVREPIKELFDFLKIEYEGDGPDIPYYTNVRDFLFKRLTAVKGSTYLVYSPQEQAMLNAVMESPLRFVTPSAAKLYNRANAESNKLEFTEETFHNLIDSFNRISTNSDFTDKVKVINRINSLYKIAPDNKYIFLLFWRLGSRNHYRADFSYLISSLESSSNLTEELSEILSQYIKDLTTVYDLFTDSRVPKLRSETMRNTLNKYGITLRELSDLHEDFNLLEVITFKNSYSNLLDKFKLAV